MKKYSKTIVATVMFATFFIAYMTLYRHVLIFHEQHYLFRFSCDYIAETIHLDGFFELAAAFMAQFGYWPWLAATIWSLLFVGIYAMGQSIIKRVTGLNDRIQLSALPPCMLFFATVNIDGQPAEPIKTICIIAAVWLAALIFGRFIPKKKMPVIIDPARPWVSIAGPVIFLAMFGWFYYDSFKPITITLPDGKERHFTRKEVTLQRKNERLMMKATQAMRRRDWDEVLALTDEQAATGTKNHLMTYFRAMALYHRGALLTNIFDNPQHHGPRSLFFPWKADKNQAEYGGYIYEELGALNTAIHWEFEALVGWGETAHHLINLSRYLIEVGRGEQARKFIEPLKHTLFYRSTARQLEQWRAEGDVPGLRDALKNAPQTPVRADNVLNLAGDANYILINDPGNEMAKQYMLLTLLMAGNMGNFYESLQLHYPPTGKPLPKVFDEALCLIRLNYGSARLEADGYVISPSTDAAYRAFLAENNKGKLASFTADQKRTLWYYLTYLSPSGKNLRF